MDGGLMREPPVKQLLTPEHFARQTAVDPTEWEAIGGWHLLQPTQTPE